MMAVVYWRYVHELLSEQVPDDFALKALWTEKQGHLPDVLNQFRRENRLQQ
jgi:hypothetical protein